MYYSAAFVVAHHQREGVAHHIIANLHFPANFYLAVEVWE